jgi:hypothetical protein
MDPMNHNSVDSSLKLRCFRALSSIKVFVGAQKGKLEFTENIQFLIKSKKLLNFRNGGQRKKAVYKYKRMEQALSYMVHAGTWFSYSAVLVHWTNVQKNTACTTIRILILYNIAYYSPQQYKEKQRSDSTLQVTHYVSHQ